MGCGNGGGSMISVIRRTSASKRSGDVFVRPRIASNFGRLITSVNSASRVGLLTIATVPARTC
jgi:hypothetical protein